MSEEQAAKWAARWGCEVEKIEGTEQRGELPQTPGK